MAKPSGCDSTGILATSNSVDSSNPQDASCPFLRDLRYWLRPLEALHMNPLRELLNYGQSVWLDYIRRGLITSGELQKHIVEDGLRGMTSNPAIFEKAMTGSEDYATQLKQLEEAGVTDAFKLYEALAIPDIQDAADILRPIY